MASTIDALTITGLRPEHWPEVSRIYAEGLAAGNATFETDAPSWEAGTHGRSVQRALE